MDTKMQPPEKALIYCRVSSKKQVEEGNGLGSQEKLCRVYSATCSYNVKKVFKEKGITGALFERPAMKELVAYLDSHPFEKYVVVFDDLKRFARDVSTHLQLKAQLQSRGARLESPNFKFVDSPEGHLIENVTAATSQYERESNKRQVLQKMKARLQDGFWCFCNPPALRNVEHPVYKRVLNGRVEPYATIFKQTIERYANDELNTLDEARKHINTQYEVVGIKKRISLNGVTNILKNPLYAGWMKYEKWAIPLQKGKHDGFISKETFDIVQTKLLGKAKPRLRKDYNLDFSLRNFVLCSACKEPMTASWTKGKLRKHPYYWCKNIDCTQVWKTIRKKNIDDNFIDLLQTTKPPQELFDLTRAIFMDIWDEKKTQGSQLNCVANNRLLEIKREITNLSERISRTNSELVAGAFEEQVEKLVNERKNIEDKKANEPEYNEEQLGTAYDSVVKALKEPMLLWRSDNFEERRTVLYMYFQERLTYNRELGFGTPKTALAINLIRSMSGPKNQLVEMPGFEPGSEKYLISRFAQDEKIFDTT